MANFKFEFIISHEYDFSFLDYYRVLYDEILKSRIEAALNTDLHKISPSARAKLIDDYFQLALSGKLAIIKSLFQLIPAMSIIKRL